MIMIPVAFLAAPPATKSPAPAWVPDAALRARVAGNATTDIKTHRFRAA
jgi:hypothetical protein